MNSMVGLVSWTPNQKRAWSTRLWFAKELGWDDEKLEKIPAEYAMNLIKIHNMEVKEIEHKNKVASMKRKR